MVLSLRRLIHQPPGQIGVFQRDAAGRLAQIGAGRVAAVGVFIEEHRLAQFLHPRRRLAGVAGVHAVVLGRGVDEDLGVGLTRRQTLIG